MAENDTTQREPIRGVFSTQEVKKIGSGTSVKKTKVKQYWLVQEISQDDAEVQPINENLIPIGKKRTVSITTLLDRFTPEPEFFITSDMFEDKDSGEVTAEGAPPQKTAADVEGFDISGTPENMEKNARAGFGLGIMYMKRGNSAKAEEIFSKLAAVDADFTAEHKHMFNDFGISLRKEKMHDTALKHYLRANELDGTDENLLHNIARVFFELGDMDSAVEYLERSLEINPSLKPSRLFLNYILKKRRKKSSGPIRMDF